MCDGVALALFFNVPFAQDAAGAQHGHMRDNVLWSVIAAPHRLPVVHCLSVVLQCCGAWCLVRVPAAARGVLV